MADGRLKPTLRKGFEMNPKAGAAEADFEFVQRPGKRALRRWLRQRCIVRALNSEVYADMEAADRLHWALRHHDHLKACSCWMCGNPRKWHAKPTIQERRRAERDARTIRFEAEGE
jgi:hypothetical protein